MVYNPFNLSEKNILITGASSGIGRQCAIQCSRMGANLILIGRNKDNLNETFNNLIPGKNITICQDITEYDQLELSISEAVLKNGKLDGLIHSAGIEFTLPLGNTRIKHYQEIFAVNVIAGLEIARIISKNKYISETGASFIFISSIMGMVGNTALTAYSATKGALIAAVRSMAIELAVKKIRVNTISPAHLTGTRMSANLFDLLDEQQKQAIINEHPLGLGNTDDVAFTCIYLLSDASRWVTGTNLIIDGGYSAR